MSIERKKEINGDLTIMITPDEEFEYIAVYSPVGFFTLKIKDGLAAIITNKESELIYEMSKMVGKEDCKMVKITEYFEMTLPTKDKYMSELN